MTIRTHLLCSTAPSVSLGYASAPSDSLIAEDFEKRSTDSAYMFRYHVKVEAVLDGLEGMKEHAEEFMPRFRDEDADDYKYRQTCAAMTNVYSDIVEGLSAKPFEETVKLVNDETDETVDSAEDSSIPDEIEKFIFDVDGGGNSLTVFAAQTFFNGINNAVDWIMVDHDRMDLTVRTIADMRARGLRPYWTHVLARNILDVQSEIIGSKEVLTFVKIMEPGEVDHIRVFERMGNGEVQWRLYRKETNKNTNRLEYVLIASDFVTIGVIPMVPFVTGRREGRRWRYDPPMKAALELQVQLFQRESGLEYATRLTAYPMLAANGIAPPIGQDGKPQYKVGVGPNRVLWSAPRSDGGQAGRWEFIEPGSESLKFLEQRIINTIQQLRELGRQPLTASSSNITVITAAVAAGKAKSAVKAWAYSLKDALENALLLTAKWMGLEYDPTVHVFAEFDDWMEGEDLDALDKARERGDISHETYCEELQRRGVLSSNFTINRERQRLLADQPGDSLEDRETPDE